MVIKIMNEFIDSLDRQTNFNLTDNGAVAHKSTLNKVYDMFAFAGAYRNRSNDDCILLFKNALEENAEMAMKCLFYIRDILEGQGERRFFRVCYHWLCNEQPIIAKRNMEYLAIYGFGRFDDIIYTAMDTPCQEYMITIIKSQLVLDMNSNIPSLLGKWLPSENTSSLKTRIMANKLRKGLGYNHKQYRKILSSLRQKIKIVERAMSEGRWSDIEFDKIPSRAGLFYKNAFMNHCGSRYEDFINSKTTSVNAGALYPYDIVDKAIKADLNDTTDRKAIEKYWNNQKDYLNGEPCKMMCVCDTSGSMEGNTPAAPINIAIGLSMYCAERIGGDFKNKYISFSSRPQFITIEGIDFVDKVRRIYDTNLCENTNIEATFELLKQACLKSKPEDRPDTLVIISDMQIDQMSGGRQYWWDRDSVSSIVWTEENAATEMEKIKASWAAAGLKCPKLIYWNVDAKNNTILDSGDDVSFVSGASPVLFQQVIRGISGMQIMTEKLNSERYAKIG